MLGKRRKKKNQHLANVDYNYCNHNKTIKPDHNTVSILFNNTHPSRIGPLSPKYIFLQNYKLSHTRRYDTWFCLQPQKR